MRQPAATLGHALLIFMLSGFGLFVIPFAFAQSNAPAIITAAVVQVSPGAETPLQVGFGNEHAVPRHAMLVFRGLPPGMRFNEGRLFGPGVWVAPAGSAAKLKVFVPGGTSGDITLNVQLATLEGEVITKVQVTLAVAHPVGSQWVSQTSANAISGTSALPPVTQPSISPEDKATALKLMNKADDYMKNGSIIVARQLYQGAADRGFGEAAFALAQTYDAQELAKLKNLVGVQPDAALAKKWYDKARDLGFSKSSTR